MLAQTASEYSISVHNVKRNKRDEFCSMPMPPENLCVRIEVRMESSCWRRVLASLFTLRLVAPVWLSTVVVNTHFYVGTPAVEVASWSLGGSSLNQLASYSSCS